MPDPGFVCVDVETANPDLASICQVGVVVFSGGAVAERWSSLVDPRDDFHPFNVGIHGITDQTVRGAPVFREVAEEVHRRLAGVVAVCHTPFDRSALLQASLRHGLAVPECQWLDSARVVRRTWTEFAQRGYGLAPVCERLGISFRHHDALEDAWAAGEIVLRAMKETGKDLSTLCAWSHARPDSRNAAVGDPEGLFHGETICFTGTLAMPRREAAKMAAAAGCDVADGVTTSTSLLVVGDQDVRKLAGHEMSSKHRRAEALRAGGHPLRILRESDFVAMLSEAGTIQP